MKKDSRSNDREDEFATRPFDRAEAEQQREGLEQIGPYRTIRELGSGGMGIVWEAEQLTPVKRTVALKVLKFGAGSKELHARFEVERQAMAMMDHSCIAKVFDAGISKTHGPYIAMEYVPGIPITEYCDRHALSIEDRLRLFARVCDAIHHAHSKGVVHRDLKPSNILVMELDDQPVPRIIDFGLAKAIQADVKLSEATVQTRHGDLLGTPRYMSPEQARGKTDLGEQCDIYSLGVILFELLSGYVPLDGEETDGKQLYELIALIPNLIPKPPSALLKKVAPSVRKSAFQDRGLTESQLYQRLTGDLDCIALKATAEEPNHRYQSASEFSEDIHRYLKHEPVSAQPLSRYYLVQKYFRRNRAPIGVAAVVLALLMVPVALATWYYGWQKLEQRISRLETEVTEESTINVPSHYPTIRTIGQPAIDRLLERLDQEQEPEARINLQIALSPFVSSLQKDVLTWLTTSAREDEFVKVRSHLDDHATTLIPILRSPVGEQMDAARLVRVIRLVCFWRPDFEDWPESKLEVLSGVLRNESTELQTVLSSLQDTKQILHQLPVKSLFQAAIGPNQNEEFADERSRLSRILVEMFQLNPKAKRKIEEALDEVFDVSEASNSIDPSKFDNDSLSRFGGKWSTNQYRLIGRRIDLRHLEECLNYFSTQLKLADIKFNPATSSFDLLCVPGKPDWKFTVTKEPFSEWESNDRVPYLIGELPGKEAEKTRLVIWKNASDVTRPSGVWHTRYFDLGKKISRKKVSAPHPSVFQSEVLHESWQTKPFWFHDLINRTPESCPIDYFAMTMSGRLFFPPGEYGVSLWYRDGVRFRINGEMQIDDWQSDPEKVPARVNERTFQVEQPGWHDFSIDFYNRKHDAFLLVYIKDKSKSENTPSFKTNDDFQTGKKLIESGFRPWSLVRAQENEVDSVLLWRNDGRPNLFVPSQAEAAILAARFGLRETLYQWLELAGNDSSSLYFSLYANERDIAPGQLIALCRNALDANFDLAAYYLLRALSRIDLGKIVEKDTIESFLDSLIDDENATVAQAAWSASTKLFPTGKKNKFTMNSRGPITTSKVIGAGKPANWFVNSIGQRMVIIDGNTNFRAEVGRGGVTNIDVAPRRFAIASTEITVRQYEEFLVDEGWASPANVLEFPNYPRGHVGNGLTWIHGAKFCNWLSKREGIPEDQWAYVFSDQEIRFAKNYLDRQGYRIPMGEEWKIAAGSLGDPSNWITSALKENSNSSRPVASGFPNRRGLFDMYGNLAEWAQRNTHPFPIVYLNGVNVHFDEGDCIIPNRNAPVFGGSYLTPRDKLSDSPQRVFRRADDNFLGLRVVRTIPN